MALIKAIDEKKYPFLLEPAFFDWWQADTRAMICPFPYRWSEEKRNKEEILHGLWALERIGAKISGEVYMPLNLGVRFFHVIMPAWLNGEQDEEQPDIFYFKDDEGMTRVRVITQTIMPTTTVFTRYWPSDYREGFERLVPCVVDVQESEEDEEKLLWIDKLANNDANGLILSVWDIRGLAEKWLDENYPDWKDPLAYWTGAANVSNLIDSRHAD
jgi:hypothetical protein